MGVSSPSTMCVPEMRLKSSALVASLPGNPPPLRFLEPLSSTTAASLRRLTDDDAVFSVLIVTASFVSSASFFFLSRRWIDELQLYPSCNIYSFSPSDGSLHFSLFSQLLGMEPRLSWMLGIATGLYVQPCF